MVLRDIYPRTATRPFRKRYKDTGTRLRTSTPSHAPHHRSNYHVGPYIQGQREAHLLENAGHIVQQTLRQHHIQGTFSRFVFVGAATVYQPVPMQHRATVKSAHVDIQETEQGEDVIVAGDERSRSQQGSRGIQSLHQS